MPDKNEKLSPISRRAFFKKTAVTSLGVAAGAAFVGEGCAYSDAGSCGYCDGAYRNYYHCDGDYCDYINYSD